jgi:hypothetical protein
MKRSVVIGLLMGGCFLPGIDPNPPEDQGANLAPLIDPRGVVPSFATFPAVLMVQPEVVSFIVTTIEDPNVDDTLFVRLYADGQPDFIFEDAIVSNEEGKVARAGFSLVLSPAQLDAFRDQTGALVGRHRLELIVADDDFLAESGEGARQVKDGRRLSYYYWELEF